MLRAPTVRTMSLADLGEPVNASVTQDKANTSQGAAASHPEDGASGRAAAAFYVSPSETHLSRLIKDHRCPVQHGKQKVPVANAQRACLASYDTHLLGHNGCILDPDQPQSIHGYLSMATQLLNAMHQVSPGEEVGRLLTVASTCANMAKAVARQRNRYAARDAGDLNHLKAGTARAMAREKVVASNAGAYGFEQLAQESEEQKRLQPFANKLVHDRSRLGQATRRHQAWSTFEKEITKFCHEAIKKFYPETVAPWNLHIDPQLQQTNPTQAKAQAVARALAHKGAQLQDEALAPPSSAGRAG